MNEATQAQSQFDFAEHERTTITEYLKVRPFYEALSSVTARIIDECLKKRNIKVHSVQHRAKDPTSLGHKAITPSDTDPNSPKYATPLVQITDLAGVRVITHFRSTLVELDNLLYSEFDIVEKSDKSEELIEEDRFGYQSIHYLIKLKQERAGLAEYERYANHLVEVQVRTILQHAWAEIEHDIQYKSATTIPSEIRRRFVALAGMLEIADREFEEIQKADRELADQASKKVDEGKLEGIEITPNALKQFLDNKLGSDGRISTWSYDWCARLLKRLAFKDLLQVETAIKPYNSDKLSSIAHGYRQGQTARFELMLLAALGERFIERHPWTHSAWYRRQQMDLLEKFKTAGIETATFDPQI